ncbi:MAG: MGMT family protein [Elusimicrobia bacterium]|nr:MGMT family protein [Elusimicrobiota bacterium]
MKPVYPAPKEEIQPFFEDRPCFYQPAIWYTTLVAIPKKVMEAMKRYPPFYQKVWRACARIPRGQVRTYGWIARRLGSPKAARAVGQALAKNPFSPAVPCHRVIGASGRMTGFSAPGGTAAKRRMLEREGAL